MKTTPVRPPTHREPPRADAAKKTGSFAKAMQEAAPPPTPFQPQLAGPGPAEAKSVRAIALPAALEGLVSEIQTSVNEAGASEVRIQFDAKTLDGLQVTITRANGKLAVEMNARSAEVSRLLTQHVEGLTAALESRGYPGPTIDIRTSTAARNTPQRDRGGQQEGGGQQNSRQR